MKIIVGINANHADSSACIIIDGKLIAAIEEERLNRIKHFSGYPIKSIQECIKIANISSNEITDIAFNTKPFSNIFPKSLFFLKNFSFKKNQPVKRVLKKINIKKKILENFELNKNVKFHFIEHHLAHIASAFYPSGFKKANGLSIDGSGDFVTCAIAECENNLIKIKKKTFFPHSLGIFYHGMTQFLGFKNYGEEYKMMGLAAYGKPRYFNKIKKNLFLNEPNDFFRLNLEYFNHQRPGYKYITGDSLEIDQICKKKLNDLFFDEINSENNYETFQKNFASSVQKVYEFFFEKIILKIVNKKFSKNLVYAGGCALNSSANQYITNNSHFDNVYINYAPGDNGGAIGAALTVSSSFIDNFGNYKSPYLGKKFSNDEILSVLNGTNYKNRISYEVIDKKKLFDLSAKIISEGNIIGWFQDEMEFGPRALGNRSILADPTNPNMKDIINKKIKRRESFRPFAPVTLKEFQNEWFESKFISQYMSSLSIVKKDKQKIIPAITHIDGTARVQTVEKSTNFKLASLIESFNKITNVPVLLNTSFNENEPIVMKPEEALDCILRNDLDYLVMSNFLIKKN
jgi:carbamoyltransferase